MSRQESLPGLLPDSTPRDSRRARVMRALVWLLVPTLAIVAFAPTLGMWFVADDFGHLTFHETLAFPRPLLAYDGTNMFYRPVSTVLTWNLGYALFGANAFPYHLISLLGHALAAYLLARATATISGDRRLGWIAGAVFGVYPLCTEPVAWLASQWDVFGAACVTGAVWGFAASWRSRDWRPYLAGLGSAALAVTMKESTLPLPLALPFVAIATQLSPVVAGGGQPNLDVRGWLRLIRRAVLWTVPYVIPAALFVGLRLYAAGRVGGYPDAATDVQHFFWDALVAAALEVLMPLNRLIFKRTFVQLVGLVISGGLLVGLVAFSNRRWPLFLLAGGWWLAFLAPALNLVAVNGVENNISNRLYYLGMLGLSIAIAAVLTSLLDLGRAGRWRYVAWAVPALVLLAAIPLTWIQLQPWTQASKQTHHIVDQMGEMLVPIRDRVVTFNVTDLPREYKGAYIFWNGLDTAVWDFYRQGVRLHEVDHLDGKQLAAPFDRTSGTYNIDFGFNPSDELYYITGMAGMTQPTDPPPGAEKVWDFRKCDTSMPGGWQVNNAATECRVTDLAFRPTNDDGSLVLQGLNLDLSGAQWVRLGVSARYPTVASEHLGEWFWKSDGATGWTQEKSHRFYLDTTQQWRVYWTYLSAEELGKHLDELRFDPVNDQLNTQFGWISLDVIAP